MYIITKERERKKTIPSIHQSVNKHVEKVMNFMNFIFKTWQMHGQDTRFKVVMLNSPENVSCIA